MRDTEDETRVLFEWECPCPPERAETESNDGGRERRRTAEFKHDARRCPERACTVLVIRPVWETRVLFDWECPHPLGVGDRTDPSCPDRWCVVEIRRVDVSHRPELRRPVQGALDIPGHPAPEVVARPLEDGDPAPPSAAGKFEAKARKHGWHILWHYARGTPLNLRKPRVVDSYRITAQSPDDGSAVVALWVDGKFDVAYGVDKGKARKLSAAQAGAWLTGGRPDDGTATTG